MKANLEKLIKEEKEKNPEKNKDEDEAKVDPVQEDAWTYKLIIFNDQN